MRVLFFVFILSSVFCFPYCFHDFDSYQYQLSRDEVQTKIERYLEKDSSIRKYYKITDEALLIGDFPQIDYTLYFASHPSAQKSSQKKGLKGAKIALDPGHFGGPLARAEERYTEIFHPHPLYFDEGTLTYMTAMILRSLLEKAGAEVFITRNGIGQGALPIEKIQDLSNFRNRYNSEDLLLRAESINAFAPDIAIIIHYNAHLTDLEKEEKSRTTRTNYNLVFVPGAFCEHELDQEKNRYEFMRLLVSSDLEESLKLSKLVLEKFTEILKVPPISQAEKTSYTQKSCLLIYPGVYARNLTMTRLVHCPLCYGESLLQNNIEEIKLLSTQENLEGGLIGPKRVEQVAQAYFEAIQNYFNPL